VNIYIQSPAQNACQEGYVLKLQKAVNCLHQAPVKFKQEVTAWFLDNGYLPANGSETVWIKRVPEKRNLMGSIVYGRLSMPCMQMIFCTS
jgi:hypothetical protein